MSAGTAPEVAPTVPIAAHGGWRAWLGRNDVFVILVGFALLASLFIPAFPTLNNLGNLFTQSALLGLLAIAQFLVVVSGGFDLSVAAVMAFSSLVFAHFVGLGFVPAALLAVLAGGACGLFNGLVITKGRVQPLIATLAMMGIARGLALSISEKSILVNDATVAALRGFSVGMLSTPTLVWFAALAVAVAWLRLTRQALHLYAVGGNEVTARLAGVAVDRIKLGVYVASGLLSGLTGVVMVVRSSSGVPLGGMGWELDTIASIVIGGVNLFGGEGRLMRAMAGVMIYQMIANVMNLSGLDPFYQDIVRAGVIVAAVGLSIFRNRKAGRKIYRRSA
ncbi:MAG: ABC transporter permease [Rhizobiaceae bacterium]|nr:ABC transporter permease [Rhizobiaceae bacterium]